MGILELLGLEKFAMQGKFRTETVGAIEDVRDLISTFVSRTQGENLQQHSETVVFTHIVRWMNFRVSKTDDARKLVEKAVDRKSRRFGRIREFYVDRSEWNEFTRRCKKPFGDWEASHNFLNPHLSVFGHLIEELNEPRHRQQLESLVAGALRDLPEFKEVKDWSVSPSSPSPSSY